MSVIHLAGGCFWGLERAVEDIPGILSTECGYANGDPHYIPDYMLVCSGRFGYREAVQLARDCGFSSCWYLTGRGFTEGPLPAV